MALQDHNLLMPRGTAEVRIAVPPYYYDQLLLMTTANQLQVYN
jgi:hypothetical protein